MANRIATRPGSGTSGHGAGIWSADEPLILINTTVSENRVDAYTAHGGGIYHYRRVTLLNSTVSGNTVTGSSSYGQGGGIYGVSGWLTLVDSAVSENNADRWGGISGAWVTATGSVVSGNLGGGVRGGLYLADTTVSNNTGDGIGGHGAIVNTTVSGNLGVGIVLGDWLRLTNSTVSGNSEGSVVQYTSPGPYPAESAMWLTHSTLSGDIRASDTYGIGIGILDIAAANTVLAGQCPLSEFTTLASNGHNIESPGNTCGFDQASDQVNVSADDLKLEALADNGGPTETHALGDGSVAIDVIPAEDCEVDTDQRGKPRPETGGTMRDVGSFEVQPEDP
jgi:hypothetical protein